VRAFGEQHMVLEHTTCDDFVVHKAAVEARAQASRRSLVHDTSAFEALEILRSPGASTGIS